MPTTVKIDSKATAVEAMIKQNLTSAVSAMATAVLSTARMKAPKKDNHLRSSASVRGSGLQRDVVFGSMAVPYAAYQERGMRADGSHKVRHYTTPGTGAHYLEEAGDAIVKKGIQAYIP